MQTTKTMPWDAEYPMDGAVKFKDYGEATQATSVLATGFDRASDIQRDRFHVYVALYSHIRFILPLTPDTVEWAGEYYGGRYCKGRVCDVAQRAGTPIVKTERVRHADGEYSKLTPPPWPLPNLCHLLRVEDEPGLMKSWSKFFQDVPSAVRGLEVVGPASAIRTIPILDGLDWVMIRTAKLPSPIEYVDRIVDDCHAVGKPVWVAGRWSAKAAEDYFGFDVRQLPAAWEGKGNTSHDS